MLPVARVLELPILAVRKGVNRTLNVCGSGVCISMNDMAGRSRTMRDVLYAVRYSRSRYLPRDITVSRLPSIFTALAPTLPRMR